MLKKTVMVLCPVVVAMLMGCDPLTRQHYDMIIVDVSNETDVQKTIGDPTYRRPDEWHYERKEQHLNVMVGFNSEGVVSRKQWIDSATGEWGDTQEAGDSSSRERTTIRTITP